MTGDQRSGAYYDPYDVEINADPYPAFARLREEAPVFHNEEYDFWALSRATDVEHAFIDWRTFSNSRGDILDVIKANLDLPPGIVLFEDPPLHAMHRSLMSRVFSPRRVAGLEEEIRALCGRCLDRLVGEPQFDWVAEYAPFGPMR